MGSSSRRSYDCKMLGGSASIMKVKCPHCGSEIEREKGPDDCPKCGGCLDFEESEISGQCKWLEKCNLKW